MRFVIDRIIDDIVIIENIETLEKKEVDIELLPSSIHEGNVLDYINNMYVLEKHEEEKRRNLIEERFKRLRSNN